MTKLSFQEPTKSSIWWLGDESIQNEGFKDLKSDTSRHCGTGKLVNLKSDLSRPLSAYLNVARLGDLSDDKVTVSGGNSL